MPRLDVAGRRHQQPHDGRADRAAPRHRGAARAASCPASPAAQARGGLCLTEPHAGSDVQAIRTTARRDGDHYVLNGSKMFITNGREGNTFALLALTDPRPQPRHRGHVVLHRREGPSRLPRREVARQARLQGRRHRRAALRGVRGAGREPGRRRRGPRLRSGDERARGRAHQHRRPLRRAWPRPPTRTRWPACARAAAAPPALADLATGVRGGAAHHLLGGRHEGPRRALRSRGRHGQAVRLRDRARGGRGRPARARRGGHAARA